MKFISFKIWKCSRWSHCNWPTQSDDQDKCRCSQFNGCIDRLSLRVSQSTASGWQLYLTWSTMKLGSPPPGRKGINGDRLGVTLHGFTPFHRKRRLVTSLGKDISDETLFIKLSTYLQSLTGHRLGIHRLLVFFLKWPEFTPVIIWRFLYYAEAPDVVNDADGAGPAAAGGAVDQHGERLAHSHVATAHLEMDIIVNIKRKHEEPLTIISLCLEVTKYLILKV